MSRITRCPQRRLLSFAFTSILLLSTSIAHADSALLTGSLGRWLDTDATPKLVEVLSKHPKFSGEVVKIVSLDNGKPVQDLSQMHQAVQAHLTQQLRKHPGVRLAWQESAHTCGVPQNLTYLLGIEIKASSAQNQSLSIGMIDVAESVWVSGVSLNWRGRLSSAERLALNRPVGSRPNGTIASPLPVNATEAIAELLQRNIRCSLPEGLNGSVYVEPAQSAALNRVRGQLKRELTLSAVAAMAASPDDAQWTIALATTSMGSQIEELVATLKDRDGEANQHLASVFVTGSNNTKVVADDVRIATVRSELLTPMQLQRASSGGVCTSHRDDPDPCVEVTFDLTRTAYLFVLSSNDRQLRSSSCERNARRLDAGPRKFRMRIPTSRHPGTADAGVYAIAVEDRSAARAIARHIRKAPGACATHSSRGMKNWLSELDEILNRYPNTYQWQAVHLDALAGELVSL